MGKKSYKKEKRETIFQKLVNLVLTVVIACAISTQMCTAANNNLRFAQISDSHFSSYEDNTSYKMLKKSGDLLEDAIFQINTSGPYDFVMFTGDLINTPKESELMKFIKTASAIKSPWYAIDGNHDICIDGGLTKVQFAKLLNSHNRHMNFDNIYYAFTPKKGFRVICLDSIIDYKVTTNGEIPEAEMKWLKKELYNHTKDVVIICTHVPIDEPYTSPGHRLNNEAEIKQLLRSFSNPIIVLQGHYHAARAKQSNNIIYISTPSLVSYPNAFRVVNINTNKNKTTVDVFYKETGLKDVQARAKIRLMGTELLAGSDEDKNTSFEIKKEGI